MIKAVLDAAWPPKRPRTRTTRQATRPGARPRTRATAPHRGPCPLRGGAVALDAPRD
jgi:hypothetical protein